MDSFIATNAIRKEWLTDRKGISAAEADSEAEEIVINIFGYITNKKSPQGDFLFYAEAGGFEPPVPFRILRFSRPARSTALPRFRAYFKICCGISLATIPIKNVIVNPR